LKRFDLITVTQQQLFLRAMSVQVCNIQRQRESAILPDIRVFISFLMPVSGCPMGKNK
jgi:hypothetical protein